jgi:hypothetical protein
LKYITQHSFYPAQNASYSVNLNIRDWCRKKHLYNFLLDCIYNSVIACSFSASSVKHTNKSVISRTVCLLILRTSTCNFSKQVSRTEYYTPTNALLFTIKYYSKMFILKHLKTLQHVSISFRSSSGSSYIPY